MSLEIESRLRVANWGLVVGLALAFGIGLWTTDFVIVRIDTPIWATFAFASFLSGSAFVALRTPGLQWPHLVRAADVLAQLCFMMLLVVPLSYVAAAAAFPLQDENLYALDRALGLDWKWFLKFANDYRLGGILQFGYTSILWPLLLIPIILCLLRETQRSYEYAFVYISCLAITVAISVFVPAVAAYNFLDLDPAEYAAIDPRAGFDHMRHFPYLRDGSMRALILGDLTGIVTFPSFHASAAIIYVWGLWPVWWLRVPSLVINALLLASTPIHGGHYFIDVFAGIALVGFCIWMARRLPRSRLLRWTSSTRISNAATVA